MSLDRVAGAHRAVSAHRATPRGRNPRPPARRRGLLAALTTLVLLLAGYAAWRTWFYESPPDVGDAGPGYWVSTRGSDGASGSPQSPWLTVQHAIQAVPDGSRIFLREGTYAPFTVDRPDLIITSAPGERATVVGRSGVRDVVLVAADGVTVSDLTVQGCVPKPDADVNITGDHGSGIRVHKVSRKVVIDGVTVRDSHGDNAAGLPVGCYGILVSESRDVHVTGNEVMNNGAGVVISRGGKGILVDNNDIHDQDRIIQNTAAKDDDFGGYGMAATFISDNPGPVFRNNEVRRNHGPSTDYTRDGGGMEIYDADNVTVTGNRFEANDGVMETGIGRSGGCDNVVFTSNTAIGGTDPSFTGDTGLVLRCSAGMVVSDNTFTNLSKFTFLLATGADFAGSINNMKITGNTVTRREGTPVWRLQYQAAPPTGLVVDKNTYRTGMNGFAILNGATSEDAVGWDLWRARTGWDKSSTAQ